MLCRIMTIGCMVVRSGNLGPRAEKAQICNFIMWTSESDGYMLQWHEYVPTYHLIPGVYTKDWGLPGFSWSFFLALSPAVDTAYWTICLPTSSPVRTCPTISFSWSVSCFRPGLTFYLEAEDCRFSLSWISAAPPSASKSGSLSYQYRYFFSQLLKPLECCCSLFNVYLFFNPYG